MVSLICLVCFGFFIGVIAKALHPGDDPVGCLPTIGIGIAGSFVGGLINWIIGQGEFLQTSGFIMSIIGSVIFLVMWRWWSLRNSSTGSKDFFGQSL